ncbi:MAG TPA: hypothetical protein DIC34_14400 [Treponema sp.]|nr:MAG: hypothetical protein A2001_10290 [Treponema sp. GWC1_61_84]HCM27712.1 hypothetical protein [Treponema sp.]
MNSFWRFLKSVRLAIGLIIALASFSTLATLIPQGLDAERYFQLYPRIVALLVTETGLSHYFSSLLFLFPAFAFFFNLSACTVSRLARELRKKGPRRHGPDILHVGLLVLVVGSLVSYSERKEGAVSLKVGDGVELPGGETLTLKSFTDVRYDDGRPKDWISVVDIAKEGKILVADRGIRVNTPLRRPGLTLYQATYGSEPTVRLIGPDGVTHRLARGETYEEGGVSVFFMTIEESGSVLLRVSNSDEVIRLTADGAGLAAGSGAGVDAGPWRATLSAEAVTGLQAVVDPGYKFVLAGLILVALGTAVTFARKIKETV